MTSFDYSETLVLSQKMCENLFINESLPANVIDFMYLDFINFAMKCGLFKMVKSTESKNFRLNCRWQCGQCNNIIKYNESMRKFIISVHKHLGTNEIIKNITKYLHDETKTIIMGGGILFNASRISKYFEAIKFVDGFHKTNSEYNFLVKNHKRPEQPQPLKKEMMRDSIAWAMNMVKQYHGNLKLCIICHKRYISPIIDINMVMEHVISHFMETRDRENITCKSINKWKRRDYPQYRDGKNNSSRSHIKKIIPPSA